MIKIEFNGSGEEVRKEMLKLLGLQEPKAQIELPVKKEISKLAAVEPVPEKAKRARIGRKAAGPSEIAWSEEDSQKLLNEIKPNAKKILAEIALKPEGYKKSELTQVLGASEPSLRGQLSSIGAALKRMGNKKSPLSHQSVDKEFVYKLDADFARFVKNYSA